MTSKDVLKTTLSSTQNLLKRYLSDLSDSDLLVRPVPEANHAAWQLGHLINAEKGLLSSYMPEGTYAELPADWAKRHGKETSASPSGQGFATKAEYINLFNQMREATLAGLEKLPESDLDKPVAGDLAQYAPTVAAMFILVSEHTLMHAGQFTVLRRKLGKPVLF